MQCHPPASFSCRLAALIILSAAALIGRQVRAAAPLLVFSADDQTSEFIRDTMRVRPYARPGALTAIDFSTLPPRVWHEENVPCSVIGPPTCIAATRDGDIILVAGAMKADPADPTKLAVDRRVTRLRWTRHGLERVAQAEIGGQPSGVALADHGHRGYVTLRAEGKVAILELSGDRGLRVENIATVALPKDSLSHLAISADETKGLATLHDKGAVVALDLGPGGIRVTQVLPIGRGPYDVKMFADGKRAVVGDTLTDTAYFLACDHGVWRIDSSVPLGHANEGIALSSDEKWMAASCFNGVLSPGPKDRWYGQSARIYLFAPSADGHWVQKQSLPVDTMPQSAVFTPDGRYLVAGEYGRGDLRVFRLERDQWGDTGLRIEIPGQPAALDMAGR